jgi:dolichol-phosphate mannosyltransferase
LLRTKNKGRGLAGVDGFKWSLEKGYDVMIEMDADFSHDPKYIPGFLSAIKECDVVLGSRFVNGGREVGRPLLRRMITRFANAYIRWILGLKVRDCNSGYRCYKRGVLENVGLDKFVSKGPSIVQEMIYRVHLKGFKIGEIPITFVEREEGSSKLGPQQLWRGYMMVLKLRFMKISGKI